MSIGLTGIHSLSMSLFMIPSELKILRKEMGLRQKDLGEILCVPYRTLQNWEQPEGSREHRKIPEEFADKIKVLAELQRDMRGGTFPKNLVWLQIPFRPDELKRMQLKADLEEKSLSALIREKLFEVLQSPLL